MRKTDKQTAENGSKGRFVPGNGGGPGRPKGTPNRFTALRDAFLDALEEVGGQEYIRKFAKRDPAKFLALVARMLPTRTEVEHAGDDDEQIKIRSIEVVRFLQDPEACQHARAFRDHMTAIQDGERNGKPLTPE